MHTERPENQNLKENIAQQQQRAHAQAESSRQNLLALQSRDALRASQKKMEAQSVSIRALKAREQKELAQLAAKEKSRIEQLKQQQLKEKLAAAEKAMQNGEQQKETTNGHKQECEHAFQLTKKQEDGAKREEFNAKTSLKAAMNRQQTAQAGVGTAQGELSRAQSALSHANANLAAARGNLAAAPDDMKDTYRAQMAHFQSYVNNARGLVAKGQQQLRLAQAKLKEAQQNTKEKQIAYTHKAQILKMRQADRLKAEHNKKAAEIKFKELEAAFKKLKAFFDKEKESTQAQDKVVQNVDEQLAQVDAALSAADTMYQRGRLVAEQAEQAHRIAVVGVETTTRRIAEREKTMTANAHKLALSTAPGEDMYILMSTADAVADKQTQQHLDQTAPGTTVEAAQRQMDLQDLQNRAIYQTFNRGVEGRITGQNSQRESYGTPFVIGKDAQGKPIYAVVDTNTPMSEDGRLPMREVQVTRDANGKTTVLINAGRPPLMVHPDVAQTAIYGDPGSRRAREQMAANMEGYAFDMGDNPQFKELQSNILDPMKMPPDRLEEFMKKYPPGHLDRLMKGIQLQSNLPKGEGYDLASEADRQIMDLKQKDLKKLGDIAQQGGMDISVLQTLLKGRTPEQFQEHMRGLIEKTQELERQMQSETNPLRRMELMEQLSNRRIEYAKGMHTLDAATDGVQSDISQNDRKSTFAQFVKITGMGDWKDLDGSAVDAEGNVDQLKTFRAALFAPIKVVTTLTDTVGGVVDDASSFVFDVSRQRGAQSRLEFVMRDPNASAVDQFQARRDLENAQQESQDNKILGVGKAVSDTLGLLTMPVATIGMQPAERDAIWREMSKSNVVAGGIDMIGKNIKEKGVLGWAGEAISNAVVNPLAISSLFSGTALEIGTGVAGAKVLTAMKGIRGGRMMEKAAEFAAKAEKLADKFPDKAKLMAAKAARAEAKGQKLLAEYGEHLVGKQLKQIDRLKDAQRRGKKLTAKQHELLAKEGTIRAQHKIAKESARLAGERSKSMVRQHMLRPGGNFRTFARGAYALKDVGEAGSRLLGRGFKRVASGTAEVTRRIATFTEKQLPTFSRVGRGIVNVGQTVIDAVPGRQTQRLRNYLATLSPDDATALSVVAKDVHDAAEGAMDALEGEAFDMPTFLQEHGPNLEAMANFMDTLPAPKAGRLAKELWELLGAETPDPKRLKDVLRDARRLVDKSEQVIDTFTGVSLRDAATPSPLQQAKADARLQKLINEYETLSAGGHDIGQTGRRAAIEREFFGGFTSEELTFIEHIDDNPALFLDSLLSNKSTIKALRGKGVYGDALRLRDHYRSMAPLSVHPELLESLGITDMRLRLLDEAEETRLLGHLKDAAEGANTKADHYINSRAPDLPVESLPQADLDVIFMQNAPDGLPDDIRRFRGFRERLFPDGKVAGPDDIAALITGKNDTEAIRVLVRRANGGTFRFKDEDIDAARRFVQTLRKNDAIEPLPDNLPDLSDFHDDDLVELDLLSPEPEIITVPPDASLPLVGMQEGRIQIPGSEESLRFQRVATSLDADGALDGAMVEVNDKNQFLHPNDHLVLMEDGSMKVQRGVPETRGAKGLLTVTEDGKLHFTNLLKDDARNSMGYTPGGRSFGSRMREGWDNLRQRFEKKPAPRPAPEPLPAPLPPEPLPGPTIEYVQSIPKALDVGHTKPLVKGNVLLSPYDAVDIVMDTDQFTADLRVRNIRRVDAKIQELDVYVGNRRIHLQEGQTYYFGRTDFAHLPPDEVAKISRRHGSIGLKDGEIVYTDTSENGTRFRTEKAVQRIDRPQNDPEFIRYMRETHAKNQPVLFMDARGNYVWGKIEAIDEQGGFVRLKYPNENGRTADVLMPLKYIERFNSHVEVWQSFNAVKNVDDVLDWMHTLPHGGLFNERGKFVSVEDMLRFVQKGEYDLLPDQRLRDKLPLIHGQQINRQQAELIRALGPIKQINTSSFSVDRHIYAHGDWVRISRPGGTMEWAEITGFDLKTGKVDVTFDIEGRSYNGQVSLTQLDGVNNREKILDKLNGAAHMNDLYTWIDELPQRGIFNDNDDFISRKQLHTILENGSVRDLKCARLEQYVERLSPQNNLELDFRAHPEGVTLKVNGELEVRLAGSGGTSIRIRKGRGGYMYLDGEQESMLLEPGRRYTVGRSSQSDLVLSNMKVSSRHLQIELDARGNLYLVDLGSTNGGSLQFKKGAVEFVKEDISRSDVLDRMIDKELWPKREGGILSRVQQRGKGNCYAVAAINTFKLEHPELFRTWARQHIRKIDADTWGVTFYRKKPAWDVLNRNPYTKETVEITERELAHADSLRDGRALVSGSKGDKLLDRAYDAFVSRHLKNEDRGDTYLVRNGQFASEGGDPQHVMEQLFGSNIEVNEISQWNKVVPRQQFNVVMQEAMENKDRAVVTLSSFHNEESLVQFRKAARLPAYQNRVGQNQNWNKVGDARLFSMRDASGQYINLNFRHAYLLQDIDVNHGTATLINPHDTAMKRYKVRLDDIYDHFRDCATGYINQDWVKSSRLPSRS